MRMPMRVLLVIPPMVQVNAPYAAAPHLAGFLHRHGYHDVRLADASLALALHLFSRQGVREVCRTLKRTRTPTHPSPRHLLANHTAIEKAVEPAVRFLQGRNPTLANRIITRQWLPEGPRFDVLAGLARAFPGTRGDGWVRHYFGTSGAQDQAAYLASLFLDDLVDAVREGVDPRFDLSRYADKLGISAASFDDLDNALHSGGSLIDRWIDDLSDRLVREHRPDVAGFTVPFPGALYGALRMSARMRAGHRRPVTVLGGGYINTELRELADPRVFDHVDYITLDAGEMPLLRLLESLRRKRSVAKLRLVRTFRRRNRRVVLESSPAVDPSPAQTGTPSFDGLAMDHYLAMTEVPNPMARLWSSGCWNKLLLSQGCYWHRCRFCDTALDHIGRYRAAPAATLVRRMEVMMEQTGRTGFHFVDEAAAPGLLRRLASTIIRRGLPVTWWGNIRFEPAFDPDLARLLERSGCVALTGGLECAEARLLKLMCKGITLEGATRAMAALSGAGILVHAYLMYGFPTQREAETSDALELVRQLFAARFLQSAYWHRFALTAHSPMACDPETFGIRLLPRPPGQFAVNEIPYEEPGVPDHAGLGEGLRKALYNYQFGIGLDEDVRAWFPIPVPRPRIPATFVKRMARRKVS